MSATASAATRLTKVITSPVKVAQALDWMKMSGTVLNINVLRDRIDLAVASHPSSYEPIQSLDSIPLKTEINKTTNRKTLSTDTVEQLAVVVQDWRVCGLVVNWPVQKEGWCGAQCGRVLHTLEQILCKSNNILSVNRPVCLWDSEHHIPRADVWGRDAVYSVTSNKEIHVASQEQYQDHNTLAADIWNDFCRAHWPEIYYKEQDYDYVPAEDVMADAVWLGDAEGDLAGDAWLDDGTVQAQSAV